MAMQRHVHTAEILIIALLLATFGACTSDATTGQPDGDKDAMEVVDDDGDAGESEDDEAVAEGDRNEDANEADEIEDDTGDALCPGIDPNTGTLCDDGDPETTGDIWLAGKCVGYKPYSCVGQPCRTDTKTRGCTCGNTFCAGGFCRRVLSLDYAGGIYRQDSKAMDADCHANLMAVVRGDVIRVFETNTWQDVRTLQLPSQNMEFQDVAISPDGTMITAIGGNMTGSIFSVANLEVVHTFEFDIVPNAIRFHPNSNILAVGGCVDEELGGQCPAGRLLLYDLDDIHNPCSVDVPGKVTDIRFSKNGSAMALLYKKVKLDRGSDLWIGSTDTLEPLWDETPEEKFSSIALSPDGARLAMASSDFPPAFVYMYTIAGHSEIWSYSYNGYAASALAFSPDGGTLTGAYNEGATQWTTDNGDIVWQHPADKSNASASLGLRYSSRGDNLYTYTGDGVFVADATDGSLVYALQHRWVDIRPSVEFSDDDTRMVLIDYAGVLWIVDIPSATTVTSVETESRYGYTLYNHQGSELVALRGDGSLVGLSTENDSYLQKTLYDVSTVYDASMGVGSIIPRAFSADDGRLFSAHGATVYQWSTATGELLSATDMPHGVCGFSADADRVITLGQDDMIRIYDMATMEEIFSLASPYPVTNTANIRYSNDTTRLVGRIGSQNFIYDMERQIYTFQGELDVYSQDVSPDGRYIAVGDRFANIQVADFEAHQSMFSHDCNRDPFSDAPVSLVRFSSSGDTLFIDYVDIVLQLLDVSWMGEAQGGE